MPISRIGRFCRRVCKILLGLIFRLFLARKQKPGVAGILRKQPTRCGRLKRWNAMLVLSIIIASCLHNEILMAARICQPVIQISGKEILNVGYKINQISVNESKKHQIILFQSIMRRVFSGFCLANKPHTLSVTPRISINIQLSVSLA